MVECCVHSLTSRRLLVTSWQRLHQYNTTNRQLLRVVSTPQYMSELYHGVETTRGTFVVGHFGTEDGRQWAVSELFSFVNAVYKQVQVMNETVKLFQLLS